MKKILICLLAAISLSCHPDIVNDNKDIVETPPQEETTDNDDDNINGGLEDPVENPEQEW
jgi:hypothetical protein